MKILNFPMTKLGNRQQTTGEPGPPPNTKARYSCHLMTTHSASCSGAGPVTCALDKFFVMPFTLNIKKAYFRANNRRTEIILEIRDVKANNNK